MKKGKITTVLFGLDGVIVDTTKQNKDFWDRISKEYNLKYDNFSEIIDGLTMNSILDLYFSIYTNEEVLKIKQESEKIDKETDYSKIIIPGVLDFIKYLKRENYKIGIVTSASSIKVAKVLKQLNLEDEFDTIVTAESIKKGKPDPMGYILAQTNLGVLNVECAVFEDAFNGIKAAIYAFMRVIGVATTLSENYLKDYTYATIKDFTDLEELKKVLL